MFYWQHWQWHRQWQHVLILKIQLCKTALLHFYELYCPCVIECLFMFRFNEIGNPIKFKMLKCDMIAMEHAETDQIGNYFIPLALLYM